MPGGMIVTGIAVIFDPNALETTDQRLFPPSRHRSARVLKKLIRRHGGVFRMKPAIFKVGDRIIAHPAFRREIERVFPHA